MGGEDFFSDPPFLILYFSIGPPLPHYTIMRWTPPPYRFLWFWPLFLIRKYRVRPPFPFLYFSIEPPPPPSLHNYRLDSAYWLNYRLKCQEVADFCYFGIIPMRYP